ncbi:testis-expressed sequence 264 protein-like [Sinocyclocheilus rhinocerous]|uniref:testis-expressed sequence 264 protein-like n=1 Tax=Sinocyclocheilus rhinocerous TaxID=307959 RepID=UPI0007B7E495|nr:PREDICTED: testis-expressed sequence 264 protein-like [Sinocyclocheilus rhinocerous]
MPPQSQPCFLYPYCNSFKPNFQSLYELFQLSARGQLMGFNGAGKVFIVEMLFRDQFGKISVPAQKCRYAVGSILSEGEDGPNEEQQQLYEKNGFRVFSFPEVTHVVTASFPHRTPLSIFLGVQRVYPQLNCYIKERKLCAHPFLEIYRGGMIHYMGPLARQDDFYVPEVREAQRWLLGKEPEEDGRTDITGADSHSERSSMSRLPPSESRDTSPAPSTTRTHSHGDGDQHWDFDHVERNNTSSVSSFEELDLDSERTDRCDHTPPPITGSGKNNLQGQDREMMVEEE